MAYFPDPNVRYETGTKSRTVAQKPSQLRVLPKVRTAACFEAVVSGEADAIILTPDVPSPQAANVETLPLNDVRMPARPTPAGPINWAITLVRMNAVVNVTT
jgi:hypothetical protein